jgi:transglutaminase-like putative cysteine protease
MTKIENNRPIERRIIGVYVILLVLLVYCSLRPASGEASLKTVPKVVTADIQHGIELYINEQVRLGGGYFNLPYKNKVLRLKLVRVHTEYLANLGPRYHFACVDLADVEGDLYDVDFFLAGDPGSMTVTETTIHKINGQPLYVWEQKKDKTWHRVQVENASHHLFGVLNGRDEFEFLYKAKLPEINQEALMWLPLPSSDSFQTIEIISINTPGQSKVLNEHEYGNKVLLLKLAPGDSKKNVELLFHVKRIEKNAYAEKSQTQERYLKSDRLIPLNNKFKNIAKKVVEGKEGELVQARALYDHVIDRMRYIRNGKGWGKGDAVYACDIRTGNCTDFHSYFIALARSVGIPARFAIGLAIPSERNEGGIHGYHCWAEFYADGKWWPVDISEADKYTNLASYYFGHHPANRIELSRGRDLVVKPGPVSGPINFLANPVLEINGKPASVKVEYSFNRIISSN